MAYDRQNVDALDRGRNTAVANKEWISFVALHSKHDAGVLPATGWRLLWDGRLGIALILGAVACRDKA